MTEPAYGSREWLERWEEMQWERDEKFGFHHRELNVTRPPVDKRRGIVRILRGVVTSEISDRNPNPPKVKKPIMDMEFEEESELTMLPEEAIVPRDE